MQLEKNSHLKSPAKVVKNNCLTKLNFKIMTNLIEIENKARMILNSTNHVEVQIAKKCSTSNHYFWESVKAYKNTPIGLKNAMLHFHSCLVYQLDKNIHKEILNQVKNYDL